MEGKRVFLLGGYDLEMVEIRKILVQHQEFMFDHQLNWGALLSSYTAILNDQDTFVGIELSEDMPLPVHYLAIDHHSQNRFKASSLEQVAKLLGIELNREQQLIAANDRGYIPAMLEMGATPEEVADIRRRDRAAQGVTEEDERLAEQSINNHLTIENGITIVKSLTCKYSAITDRLFPCAKLLVYTDHDLTYFGENVSLLILEFKELINGRKAFSGGGENGFFGIAHNCLSVVELNDLKTRMIEILNTKIK